MECKQCHKDASYIISGPDICQECMAKRNDEAEKANPYYIPKWMCDHADRQRKVFEREYSAVDLLMATGNYTLTAAQRAACGYKPGAV